MAKKTRIMSKKDKAKKKAKKAEKKLKKSPEIERAVIELIKELSNWAVKVDKNEFKL